MNILITGANGLLGGKIIKSILRETEFDVLAVASSERKILEMQEREKIFENKRIHFLSNSDFLNPMNNITNVYGAIHLAFARRTRPASEIADSINYATKVFRKLSDNKVNRVINISSQGIYGNTEGIRTEETVPAPENHYTMAKYATEIIFNDIMFTTEFYTNLRLDLVTQSQNIVKALCSQAINGKISLRGGQQVFSFIDAEDVGDAVVAMLLSKGEWDTVYNVGWNRTRYSLIELATIISDATSYCGLERPEIELDRQDIKLWAGMDTTKFTEKTKWNPIITLDATIKEYIKHL